MGGIWIETSSDVYFRERNEDKKVFKNIEIWALIAVAVDGAMWGRVLVVFAWENGMYLFSTVLMVR